MHISSHFPQKALFERIVDSVTHHPRGASLEAFGPALDSPKEIQEEEKNEDLKLC